MLGGGGLCTTALKKNPEQVGLCLDGLGAPLVGIDNLGLFWGGKTCSIMFSKTPKTPDTARAETIHINSKHF